MFLRRPLKPQPLPIQRFNLIFLPKHVDKPHFIFGLHVIQSFLGARVSYLHQNCMVSPTEKHVNSAF